MHSVKRHPSLLETIVHLHMYALCAKYAAINHRATTVEFNKNVSQFSDSCSCIRYTSTHLVPTRTVQILCEEEERLHVCTK